MCLNRSTPYHVLETTYKKTKTMICFRIFFCVLRTWPLGLIYFWKTRIVKDIYAMRWFKDVEAARHNGSFFSILAKRPYYRDLFYHRFHLPVSVCLPLFGGCNIAIPRIDIGEGLFLEHPHGSYLNAVSIGKNFTCLHNVTIGKSHDGIPTIGDNVFCGCGACILGPIHIGNNVKIGANAVVVKDIPDNSVVVGNPGIIVKRNGKRITC